MIAPLDTVASMRPPPRSPSGMARAALICGIAGLPLFFLLVPSAVAVVLGTLAASQAKDTPAPHAGLGAARTGWALGTIGVVLFAVLAVVVVWR